MDISLIIPAHNEEAYIGQTLDVAIKNTRGKLREIIVVDNASTDKTAEIAQLRIGVRVVKESQKGTSHAQQTGMEEARGEFLAYIDADSRIPEGWLEMVEGIFADNPDAVSLSGPARYWDGSLVQNIVMWFFWWTSAPLTYRVVGYMMYGANFVVKKEAIAAAGGFDRSIRFYGDDTDTARRLASIGRVIFRMDFFIYTSARRFNGQGLFRTNFVYALNYLWPVLFHRPYSLHSQDVR